MTPFPAVLLLVLAASPATAREHRTQQIIVRFKHAQLSRAPALPAARLERLSARAGAALSHRRTLDMGAQVLRLPARLPLERAREIARRLAGDPEVEWAEPDAPVYPALTPNDTLYSSQWHYFAPSSEVAGANFPNAWDITVGATGTVVAVVDTGLTGHAEFSGRTVSGYDFISDANIANDGGGRDADPSDPGDWVTQGESDQVGGPFEGCAVGNSSWHGTHVAGTIGAATNNGSGVAGGNWSAKILPVRVLGKCGGLVSDVADGIRWAAGLSVSGVPSNANPAKVLNLSLSGPGACGATYQNAINAAVAAGAIVVVSAGNDNENISGHQPASCSSVVTVAAVRRNGGRAGYSNFGAGVAIAAPGGQMPAASNGVLSLLDSGTQSPSSDTTGFYQGTSQAAPHVSAALSLLHAVAPAITPAAATSALAVSTRAFPTGTGNDCSTSDCGAGLLDAYKLVLNGSPVTAAPGNLRASSVTISRIEWSWDAAPNAVRYDIAYASNTASLIAGGVAATSFALDGLASNFQTAVFVRGVNTWGGSGPGATSPSTATLAQPVASAQLWPHSSSITVTYAACPVAPASLSCSGYVLQASTASNFTGTLFSAGTGDRSVGSLQVSGLATGATYHLRLGTLNVQGQPNFSVIGTTRTSSPLLAPGAAPFSDESASQLRLNWNSGGNPGGVAYLAEASAQADFSGAASASGTDLFTALFSGLAPNTTYFFRVQALPGGPYLQLSTPTLPAAPAPQPFVLPGVGQLTAQWSGGANPAGTRYQAQLSTLPDFSALAGSSQTLNGWASFGGLSPNATYYARVRALNHQGAATPFIALGPAATLALEPAAASPPFSAVGDDSLTAHFNDGGNPGGTLYLARLSTSPGFSGAADRSLITAAGSAAFAGLLSNATYYFQAAALNHGGVTSSFFAAVATATLARPPSPASPMTLARTESSLRLAWGRGNNAPGTVFAAELSADPGFGGGVQSSATANEFADFTGLLANTAYFLRVRALAAAAGRPPSAWAVMGSSATLPVAPAPAASSIVAVGYSSVTVAWTPLAAAPPQASCSGYRVEAALDAGFTVVARSLELAGPSASSAALAPLEDGATYYFRVGSLNAEGAANYLFLGSTVTARRHKVQGTVAGAGLQLSISPAASPIQNIALAVPAGAFPAGTVVVLNASVETELPEPVSNQARLTPLLQGAGFELSAGGLQPAAAVLAVLRWDPAQIPAGRDPRTLQLARYDPGVRRWTLLPSHVDASARTLSASLPHFSFFAPFFVDAAEDLAGVQIFPIPWEPASSDPRFGSPFLTFANLPAESRVRAFTVGGELVWEGTASAGGVLQWDGRTRFGRRAGTGTYMLLIEGGGRRVVRRAVLIR